MDGYAVLVKDGDKYDAVYDKDEPVYFVVFYRSDRASVAKFYEKYKHSFNTEVLFVQILFSKSQEK